mgnify:FL=1
MANKEERLIRLIRREQSGKGGNYEEICELLFDEINNLVRPVCQSAEESRKKVKKLFVRMLQQIDEIDTNDDIHLWIAGFTTVTLYELLCRENGQIITYRSGNIDYQYSHIDDDDELRLKVRDYNDALANPKRYMFGKEFFSKLSKGQIILFEMFCYEGFTIDEIQELLEVDKIYITSELAAIKAIVLGNTDEEVELISENDTDNKENVKSYASEDDNDDIAAIKAAVAAIVNDTVDEVNTENEGYKDIVSAVNAIKSEPDYNNNDTLGATLVNINKEHINNIIKNSENKTGKDDTEIELTEDKLKNDTPKSEKKAKTKDIEADYIDEDEADADYDKSDKKKGLAGLFGFEDLSDEEDDEDEADNKTVKRDRMADDDSLVNSGKTNKILKILSIVVPSVAVVVFIVILLTSGVFNKSSSTSNSVTAAETKTSTKKQESTTQESTTAKATEKSTQKTTAAKQTEQTTTAKQVEKTTEAKTEAQNNNTTRTSQQQNNQADNDSDTQATESNTQATEGNTQATAAPTQATAAPTQATEGSTQATEGNTQATAAPTEGNTQATAAPTQADTVVDEKNGTALH